MSVDTSPESGASPSPSSHLPNQHTDTSTSCAGSRGNAGSPAVPTAAQPAVPPASAATRNLRFSVEEILNPDFGRKAIESSIRCRSRHSSTSSPPSSQQASPASSASSPVPSQTSPVPSQTSSSPSEERTTKPDFPLQKGPLLWPAWVYCTRYSDRPSSGPRSRRAKKDEQEKKSEEKRPRTAFTQEQLAKLKKEFEENRYLTEKRRQDLARDLNLNENQIKIWFQNKRAKIKKTTGNKGGLALQLMAQGLYNHSTAPMEEDDD